MHLSSPPAQLPTLFPGSSSCCCLSPFSPTGGNNHNNKLGTNFPFPPSQQQQQQQVKEEFPFSTPSLHPDHYSITTPTQTSSCYSPMVVSPNMSTLNTPRGSITSVRSQHSPMNTDLSPSSGHASSTLMASQLKEACEPLPPAPHEEDVNIFQSMYDDFSIYPNYPSPPRSGYASPVHEPQYGLPPPSYDQHMSLNYGDCTYAGDFQMQPDLPLFSLTKCEENINNSTPPHLIHSGCVGGGVVTTVNDPNLVSSTSQQHQQEDLKQQQLLHHHQNHMFPDILNDTLSCPETPDSSVKDESGDRGAASTSLYPPNSCTPPSASDSGCYVCLWTDCNNEYDSQRALVDHVTEAHVESGKKGCEERPCLWKNCPRKLKPFNAKYKLSTHMRVHTKEKPYKCEFEGCTRAFARLENRKIHLRSHTGQKPFPCKFAQEFNCTKRFSNSSDRAKHEQTHKDPKPYRCEVVGCTKRYTDPSSLRKHVKSHTLEEQEQYRRYKDQMNQTKSSNTTSSSYGLQMEQQQQPQQQYPQHDVKQTALHHIQPNATTLLAVGLQAGGTMMNMEEASPSPGSGCSPLQKQSKTSNNQVNTEGYPGLAHQPSSLDDLDGETLPFDDVPVRFEGSDSSYNVPAGWPNHSSHLNEEDREENKILHL